MTIREQLEGTRQAVLAADDTLTREAATRVVRWERRGLLKRLRRFDRLDPVPTSD